MGRMAQGESGVGWGIEAEGGVVGLLLGTEFNWEERASDQL